MTRRTIAPMLAWGLAWLFAAGAAAAASAVPPGDMPNDAPNSSLSGAPNDAPGSTTGVEEEIRHAARVWLANYARLHGWEGAKVDAHVAALHQPAPRCDVLYDITPVNTDQPARLMFAVRCPVDSSLTYYEARGTIVAKAVVTTAPVAAGKPLDAQAVTLSERDLAALPDAIVDPAALAFEVSRRTLKPGQVLQARYLESEKLVRRDQPVLIVAQLGALEISTTGVAAQDGVKDALIRVRSGSANRVIAARVTGRGTVAPVAVQ